MIWNTLAAAVANVEADSADDAIGKLSAALAAAGFNVYPEAADAFESECDVTEADL